LSTPNRALKENFLLSICCFSHSTQKKKKTQRNCNSHILLKTYHTKRLHSLHLLQREFQIRQPEFRENNTSAINRWVGNAVYNKILNVKWSRYRPDVAQRAGRCIALLFRDRGTRSGWEVSSTSRPHFTPGKDPVHILQEDVWAPGPVWTGGKSHPHWDSIPDVQPVVSRYTDWATGPT